MSDERTAQVLLGDDLGAWAANEISKHEEICGLRYQGIEAEMKRIREAVDIGLDSASVRSKIIEDKISDAIKWVLGIVSSLCVALVIMSLNSVQASRTADDADKRELRARLSLLTARLENVSPRGTVVVAPAGSVSTAVPAPSVAPIDPDDLAAAAGEKPK